MKLSHSTIRNLSIPLLFIMLLWSGMFYVLIMHEIDDETNDTLENYKELIIRKILTDPSFNRNHNDEMTRYRIREVTEAEADLSANIFYDSTTYIEIELEYEPVRVLKCYFMDAEGRYYEMEIETSTLEKEDMVRTIFWSILILYFILLCCILLVTHYVFRKSFKPFYGLLNWLKKVHPGKKVENYEIKSNVDEFITLNQALIESVNRNSEIYNRQKQFVENAAHELQTPLAIINNKLELLSENPDCTEEQLAEIGSIYKVLRGIIKMNKSLLLLSRIENRQYPETTAVDINSVTRSSLDIFTEVYGAKLLKISFVEDGCLSRDMNESLAGILVSNLIKNAFVHNYSEGEITIKISRKKWTISNTSRNAPLADSDLYSRFNKKGNAPDSSGLGLAIVKSITVLYGITIEYQYAEGKHRFSLGF